MLCPACATPWDFKQTPCRVCNKKIDWTKYQQEAHQKSRDLKNIHEIDLANVVLAYDTRTETLENRVNVYKSNGSKLQTMLEQAQSLLRGQRSQVKELRQEREYKKFVYIYSI